MLNIAKCSVALVLSYSATEVLGWFHFYYFSLFMARNHLCYILMVLQPLTLQLFFVCYVTMHL